MIIPLFVQNELDAADADLLSRFNFLSSSDEALPFSTGTVSTLDRQHLWGLFIGIPAGASVVSADIHDVIISSNTLKTTFISNTGVTVISSNTPLFTFE